MEAVDVFDGLDGADHAQLADVLMERQLDEDAVDRVVGVQHSDPLEQFVLRRLVRQPDVGRANADLLRRFVLAPDVDVVGRIVTDEDRRQPERAQLGDVVLHFGANPLRERLAVHQGRHGPRR